jgi:hypothetical protein
MSCAKFLETTSRLHLNSRGGYANANKQFSAFRVLLDRRQPAEMVRRPVEQSAKTEAICPFPDVPFLPAALLAKEVRIAAQSYAPTRWTRG